LKHAKKTCHGGKKCSKHFNNSTNKDKNEEKNKKLTCKTCKENK
jgi:hypothetical protein